MSLGNPSVECFSVYEPRCNLSNVAQRQYAIVRGGNSITPYVYNAISLSSSTAIFQANPPSRQTILDRIAIAKFNVTLAFTGTVTSGTNLLQEDFDAFRAWPISSVTNTLVSQINGFSVSIEMSRMIHAITRFNQPHDLQKCFLSATPQMEDNIQDYRSADGLNTNPLNGVGDNTAYPSRGSYPYTLNSNTPTAANITANLYEYVVLPPYIFDGNEAGGLTHIDTLTFTYNFTNLSRMWSHSPANTTISSLAVTFNSAQMMLFYITPRITDFVPSTLVYPYYQVTNYRTSTNTPLVYNGSVVLQSNVIQLQSIPNRIIIYAKQSDTIIQDNVVTLTGYTDTFMQINSLKINWNNINGVYSGADPIQLWQTAVQNGLSMSYSEWNGVTNGLSVDPLGNIICQTGGIICLEPGKDIPCRDDEAPGMLGQYNLQVSLGVTNINPYSVTTPPVAPYTLGSAYLPELNIICVYEGILTIQDNSTLAQIGVVSKQDALTAPTRYDICYSALEAMYGGNFFTKIRDWVKNKAVPWVKEHGPTIAKVASMAAPLVGLGMEGGAPLKRKHLKPRLNRI